MRTCSRNDHIQCESKDDRACASCLASVSNEKTREKDFEAFLRAKGFPASFNEYILLDKKKKKMITKEVDLNEKTTGKKLKTTNYNHDCLEFVTYQVKHGVSFEEAVRKIGYYPKPVTPPDCGSYVKVPKGQKEVLLEQLLEEVKRIKLILTVGKEI